MRRGQETPYTDNNVVGILVNVDPRLWRAAVRTQNSGYNPWPTREELTNV